jgi:hypothetical protein
MSGGAKWSWLFHKNVYRRTRTPCFTHSDEDKSGDQGSVLIPTLISATSDDYQKVKISQWSQFDVLRLKLFLSQQSFRYRWRSVYCSSFSVSRYVSSLGDQSSHRERRFDRAPENAMSMSANKWLTRFQVKRRNSWDQRTSFECSLQL